jgi:geranylgeranyl reductase family protein
MSPSYDVIVAGGGPAGATAAFFLGQAGRRVLVLEKQEVPRYKTCGGAVSAHVLAQFPISFENVIETRVKAISYALGQDRVTIPLEDESLCMVMRAEFDAHLLKHVPGDVRTRTAVREVEERAEGVTVTTSTGERVEAEYLVAADGANSIIARQAGLRKKRVLAGAIEVEARVPQEVRQRYAAPVLIFGEVALGYLWIFPKAAHLSVGIGALNPRPGVLQATLERVMDRFGVPIEGQPRSGTRRVLLAGDAAGLVDPFTGEGIRLAIRSGRLAAEAILAGRPERYTAMVERSIGLNHRLGAALTAPFYGMPRPSFELALRNPQLSQSLVNMVGGRIGYAMLMWRVAASFPGFMLGR